MRLLYLVFIASTLALLWAVWAIARTVRSHRQVGQRPSGSLSLEARPSADRDDNREEP